MNSPSSASPSWPASATSAMSAHTESGASDVITIKDNTESRVYNMERNPVGRTFDMEFQLANNSVQAKSFVWYVNKPTDADPNQLEKIESANAEARDGTLFQRSLANNETFVCLNVTAVDSSHHDVLSKVMVIGIAWNSDKQEGETLSSAFSITPNGTEQTKHQVWGEIQGSYYNISREKAFPSGGSGGHSGFAPPNNSSDGNNGTGISNIPTIGGNSSSSQTHSRGRGGLGTGAIAGIAVGVGIAALLAAALGIFFFLRRRRDRGTPSTTALHHTHAAEQEKLSSFAKGGVAGGASASDAAIAPYRDDNSTLTNSHDRRRSSAAAPVEDVVRDRQPSPPKTAAAAAAAESRHSRTGNGVSRHLVEDGMTAEDIRRLEAEEAHLDHEIQRVNGTRR